MADQVAGTKRKAAESAEELRAEELRANETSNEYKHLRMLGPSLQTLKRLIDDREATAFDLLIRSLNTKEKLKEVQDKITEEEREHKRKLDDLRSKQEELQRRTDEMDRQINGRPFELRLIEEVYSNVVDTHSHLNHIIQECIRVEEGYANRIEGEWDAVVEGQNVKILDETTDSTCADLYNAMEQVGLVPNA